MAAAPVWQKSSFSGNGDAPNCVEIAAADGAVHLRESGDPVQALSATPAGLAALIRHIRGEAD
ncbi:DUF397 domain-containing protein [Streptomyces piniterrae]|uniref:DUF397 domain-containing protein n=1 Tax=Streptomyces piniterrae TaxID=2571125 RepID=A0A4U0MM19_9ACTN|nr:DUF397 domain-containing protein [Streptomyces piniterrae]TJZ41466.1 DUF397 domain-containing protein [Streptomyces piniterrae]